METVAAALVIMEVVPTQEVATPAPTQEVALTLVAPTQEVATPALLTPKIHKQTPADKLHDVLETLKGLNLDHKIIKVAKTQQVIFKDNVASKKPFYTITIELNY